VPVRADEGEPVADALLAQSGVDRVLAEVLGDSIEKQRSSLPQVPTGHLKVVNGVTTCTKAKA
ncbi:hypothetical protein, partial [Amycolatopsis sp. NPDC051071]|uniref:hypothetical protein n=1 Tax=Amycolatopsis sp. NPDC051071 TaxID=3154637 RepID=UPI00342746EA